MKIIVKLMYHGAQIDARGILATRGRHAMPIVEIEIGRLIDERKEQAVRNIIGEPPDEPPLDVHGNPY